MKKAYPKYEKGELKAIKKKLSKRNKEELDKFSVLLLRTNGQAKVEKIFRQLLAFNDVTGLNFYEKPSVEIRDKFLALLNNSDYKDSYKREVKVYLKKWLKWRWKDLYLLEDFPKLNNNGSEKVKEQDLLTDEEIKKMLMTEKNQMWRTIISLLYETGCRPDEILSLKWKDIKFSEAITDIQFITKKKSSVYSRVFPVQATTPFLKEWRENNPNAKNDDLVFANSKGEKISRGGLNFHLKELAKKCGIEKNVFSYLFRFSACSRLYDGKNNLDDRNVASLMGHSVNMARTYHKISNKTAREKLIENVYKHKQLTREEKNELEELKKIVQAQGKKLLAITIEKDLWFDELQNKFIEQQNKFYEKIKEKGWLKKN